MSLVRPIDLFQIILPNANNRQIDLALFVASWQLYADEGFDEKYWQEFVMPILSRKEGFDPCHKGLDGLCRQLSAGYWTTMQADRKFLDLNRRFLTKTEGTARNLITNRNVNGAQLTNEALEYWNYGIEEERRQQVLVDAKAILSADQEAEDRSGNLTGKVTSSDVLNCTDLEPPWDVATAKVVFENLDDLLVGVIRKIHCEPYQGYFRKRPEGSKIVGWPARLEGYFWPTPAQRSHEVRQELEYLFRRLRELVAPLGSLRKEKLVTVDLREVWPADEVNDTAKGVADDIFRWGGVPQRDVTSQKIFNAIRNALSGVSVAAAPMNSGWTKLAAFAADPAVAGRELEVPQVIWDSRVSTALIDRIDSLIIEEEVGKFPELTGLRLIPGRGGYRPQRQRRLMDRGWKVGWGANPWEAHFRGGRLIARMRDLLNRNLDAYGRASSTTDGLWTMRSVEMVLFMDGY